MSKTFFIPRQSDRSLVLAFGKVRKAIGGKRATKIVLEIQHFSTIELADEKPAENPTIKRILDLDSETIDSFRLIDQNGGDMLSVRRELSKANDVLSISDDWLNRVSSDRPERKEMNFIGLELMGSARREFKAGDLDATFDGQDDNSWGRYKQAQLAVLNSLQQATESLVIRVSENAADLDKQRAERFEKLEVELRAQIDRERKELHGAIEGKQTDLNAREKAFAAREAGFNTKEARYVARQKQDEQIEQIKKWLESWQLTDGTSEKRKPILMGYIIGLVVSFGVLIAGLSHTSVIVQSVGDLAVLKWWHWLLFSLKVVVPFAAFTTFLVYFIKWNSLWARQHAEEEFRNRTLLIDIGRSGWLLEAVRDAHENNKEIPPDFLKELSRNLFASYSAREVDAHPQTLSDLTLNGLASLRVKSPDGSEVEAVRGKKTTR